MIVAVGGSACAAAVCASAVCVSGGTDSGWLTSSTVDEGVRVIVAVGVSAVARPARAVSCTAHAVARFASPVARNAVYAVAVSPSACAVAVEYTCAVAVTRASAVARAARAVARFACLVARNTAYAVAPLLTVAVGVGGTVGRGVGVMLGVGDDTFAINCTAFSNAASDSESLA